MFGAFFVAFCWVGIFLFRPHVKDALHQHQHLNEILANFLRDVCGCQGLWKMQTFIDRTVEDIRALPFGMIGALQLDMKPVTRVENFCSRWERMTCALVATRIVPLRFA